VQNRHVSDGIPEGEGESGAILPQVESAAEERMDLRTRTGNLLEKGYSSVDQGRGS